ncbi:unnamed protein product, partial [Staurois parvus]
TISRWIGDSRRRGGSEKTGLNSQGHLQGRTDNSWGPRAIGDHGAPVSLPKLKRAYEKGTRGISCGPLLTRALGQCLSFQMVSPPL